MAVSVCRTKHRKIYGKQPVFPYEKPPSPATPPPPPPAYHSVPALLEYEVNSLWLRTARDITSNPFPPTSPLHYTTTCLPCRCHLARSPGCTSSLQAQWTKKRPWVTSSPQLGLGGTMSVVSAGQALGGCPTRDIPFSVCLPRQNKQRKKTAEAARNIVFSRSYM